MPKARNVPHRETGFAMNGIRAENQIDLRQVGSQRVEFDPLCPGKRDLRFPANSVKSIRFRLPGIEISLRCHLSAHPSGCH